LDPRARRYIISFNCVETFVSNGLEFAVLEIKGQSFMLHQIRKMVATIVAVVRKLVPQEKINEAFKLNKLEMPIAPSLGLCLCYVRNFYSAFLLYHFLYQIYLRNKIIT
jgi:tRNA pseudouridine38-40 synthase